MSLKRQILIPQRNPWNIFDVLNFFITYTLSNYQISRVLALNHPSNTLVISSLGIWMLKDFPGYLSLFHSPDNSKLIVLNTVLLNHTSLLYLSTPGSIMSIQHYLLLLLKGMCFLADQVFSLSYECTSSYLFCAFARFSLLCGMKILILSPGHILTHYPRLS